MRAFFLLALILLCVPAVTEKPIKSKGKFTVSYDKFKDVTTMTMAVQLSKDWTDARAPTMMATHSFPGQQFRKPDKILLSFYSDAREWTFLEDWQRSFIAITDTKRVNFGTMQRLGSDIRLGSIVELAGVWVVPQSFLEIATAKTVELQLGRTVIKLKPEYLVAFHEFGIKTQLLSNGNDSTNYQTP